MEAPSDGSIWRAWILACVIGEMLGIGVSSIVISGASGLAGDPGSVRARALMLGTAVLAGAIEGVALGYFQWRVLKRRFPTVTAKAWVGITAAIAALGWFVGILPSLFAPAQPQPGAMGTPPGAQMSPGAQVAALTLALLIGGGLTGAVFGTAQWFVLRKHALQAGQWIWANALGWALALAWIFLGAMLPTGSTGPGTIFLIGIVAGILAGVTYGTITGGFLLRIFPRPLVRVGEEKPEKKVA